ncbi:MAG TPA: hypothetical protein PK079_18880 [Leptospiraceae bacterium]|nr:hypothetical protein [Leptospiraceae bacterium]HMW07254.1 hypothetical protein [Leptospiraceae bacterium]HMX34208.1 hypothetical protein [Leptospiraceae bacterium]HMY32927.1 hypothetical protein [Leptospiraceae bacterium]HMZ66060.1 hypothetical protein [Leptospiraceae bacterium]
MKTNTLFKFLLLSFIAIAIYSQNNDKPSSFFWTESQGKMTLSAAKTKCASLGLRLPTRDEIISAHSKGETKTWKKDGELYWTLDGYSEEYGYSFDITKGSYGYYEGKLERTVRCITSENNKVEVTTAKNIQKTKWSDYLGLMTWEDAKKKCESLGLRLPTKEEMIQAYQNGETKSWEKEGEAYWTSTEFSKGTNSYYYFGVVNGFSSHYGGKDDDGHVRCIQ